MRCGRFSLGSFQLGALSWKKNKNKRCNFNNQAIKPWQADKLNSHELSDIQYVITCHEVLLVNMSLEPLKNEKKMTWNTWNKACCKGFLTTGYKTTMQCYPSGMYTNNNASTEQYLHSILEQLLFLKWKELELSIVRICLHFWCVVWYAVPWLCTLPPDEWIQLSLQL